MHVKNSVQHVAYSRYSTDIFLIINFKFHVLYQSFLKQSNACWFNLYFKNGLHSSLGIEPFTLLRHCHCLELLNFCCIINFCLPKWLLRFRRNTELFYAFPIQSVYHGEFPSPLIHSTNMHCHVELRPLDLQFLISQD